MAGVGTLTVTINATRSYQDFVRARELAEILRDSHPFDTDAQELCEILGGLIDCIELMRDRTENKT